MILKDRIEKATLDKKSEVKKGLEKTTAATSGLKSRDNDKNEFPTDEELLPKQAPRID